MPVLFLIGSLLALWAFIVWERRRPVQPMSRQAMSRGWSPSVAPKWSLYVGLALVFTVLGSLQWLNPSHPPFTGRGSWLNALAYTHLGPQGLAIVWWAATLLLIALAFASWRTSSRGGHGGGAVER